MATRSIRAYIPESVKRIKRRVVSGTKRAADTVVLSGIVRPWLSARHSGTAAKRTRPHVLMVRYANYGPDPAQGESSEAFLLDRTLGATNRATCDQFFWDRDFGTFPRGDWALLERCVRVRPDALLLSSYDPTYQAQARVETIRIIRKTWGIPIVAFWWDTCWEGFWPSIQSILPYVDVHIVADNPLLTFLDRPDAAPYRRRFLALWSSFDPALYTNPGRDRDVSVSFRGQVDAYRSDRVRYLEHLKEQRIPLVMSLAGRAEQPPLAQYVELLQRSKIGLNFSQSVDAHQLKGRVFETMLCGAMLMESDNPQTRCYFRPMTDYVSFASPDDLVDKIQYHLAHDDERARIAASGEQRARSLYNHEIFWARVFDGLARSREWPL